MTRRLLSACVGAALVGILSVPAHGIAKPPDLPEDGTFTAAPVMAAPAPLFQLRPTARRTMAGSLLMGIHPALGLLRTDKILDVPDDHPQTADEDWLLNLPKRSVSLTSAWDGRKIVIEEIDYLKCFLLLTADRVFTPTSEEIDGSIGLLNRETDLSFVAVDESPDSETDTPTSTIEVLPMPREDSDVTCPFLRQQRIDKHACQFADPEFGRDVLANLESLKEADKLLELSAELARDSFFIEAMVCCEHAAKLCPGSPCAERALNNLNELARGIVPQAAGSEESAEPQPDEPTGPCSQGDPLWGQMFEAMGFQEWSRGMTLPNPNYLLDSAESEPGVKQLVVGLMKACHLLMSQGMQHQAAELARQAYALDPQRVTADPLIYKMHLLAESQTTSTAGSSEESEPPTCPYCPKVGKPIREIVPEMKQNEDGPATLLVPPLPPIDYEVVPVLDNLLTETAGAEEASEEGASESMQELIETMLDGSLHAPIAIGTKADGGLRVFGDCSLGDTVYHVRYTHGCLAIWKTTDASK